MSPIQPAPDPVLGPRVLFFSGGTALRGVSRLLPRWTHRSIHLVTPFDSGGSSAALRGSLSMPAVGDLRNRLLALADVSSPPVRALHDALAHRLPGEGTPAALRRDLGDVLQGLPDEAAAALHGCLEAVGPRFDLRYASVGNLVLAGMYLAEGRSLQSAAARFSALVRARGTVCPVAEDDVHLAAELADGSVVVGQHRITRPDDAGAPPIRRVFLVRSPEDPAPASAAAPAPVLELIGTADLVCFPIGSFFTSILAALLPDGIAEAVVAARAPRVYVPNPAGDPEERGMSLADKVRALRSQLLRGAAAGDTALPGPAAVLDAVLLDAARAAEQELEPIRGMGIRVARAPLGAPRDPDRYDDPALLDALSALLSPSAPPGA